MGILALKPAMFSDFFQDSFSYSQRAENTAEEFCNLPLRLLCGYLFNGIVNYMHFVRGLQ